MAMRCEKGGTSPVLTFFVKKFLQLITGKGNWKGSENK